MISTIHENKVLLEQLIYTAKIDEKDVSMERISFGTVLSLKFKDNGANPKSYLNKKYEVCLKIGNISQSVEDQNDANLKE